MRVHLRLRLPLRLHQIATLRLWDVVSNAETGYRTHYLHQIANKNAKKNA